MARILKLIPGTDGSHRVVVRGGNWKSQVIRVIVSWLVCQELSASKPHRIEWQAHVKSVMGLKVLTRNEKMNLSSCFRSSIPLGIQLVYGFWYHPYSKENEVNRPRESELDDKNESIFLFFSSIPNKPTFQTSTSHP
ncbi:hypothetical protein TNCV_2877431 [Trichonephila clavipes]|uniref:Uncharacterized protein n=1 Tax=Trichonephila clavipes TaxID=2585209 RepID=A0A8X6WDS8_TRICX|nr:hypothetical protein TNCV_2877431 [Trichonephila clavipes]